MIEIVRLSEKDAIYYWSGIKDLIQKGLDRTDGEYSVENYKEYIECEYWQLWIALDTATQNIKAIAITEIIEYPNFNELLIRLIAGQDRKIWMNLVNQQNTFIDYAIKNNCKRLVMNGRKGWLKVLNKLNWNEGYTVMTKEINIVEKGE